MASLAFALLCYLQTRGQVTTKRNVTMMQVNEWKLQRNVKKILVLCLGLAMSAQLAKAEEPASAAAPKITDSCPGILDVNRLLQAMRQKVDQSPNDVRPYLYNLTFADDDTSNPLSRVSFAGSLMTRLPAEVSNWYASEIHFENCRELVIKNNGVERHFRIEQDSSDEQRLKLREYARENSGYGGGSVGGRLEFFAPNPDALFVIISEGINATASDYLWTRQPETARRYIASCDGTPPHFNYTYSRVLHWGKSDAETREAEGRAANLVLSLTTKMMQTSQRPGALIDNANGCVVNAATPKPDPTQYCSGCHHDDQENNINLEGGVRQPIRYRIGN